MSPCTHYINFIAADWEYYLVIYYKPGISRLNAISEAKISKIVTRHISSAVVYNDADEVVNQVTSKL